jgi:hypothetical protein
LLLLVEEVAAKQKELQPKQHQAVLAVVDIMVVEQLALGHLVKETVAEKALQQQVLLIAVEVEAVLEQ